MGGDYIPQDIKITPLLWSRFHPLSLTTPKTHKKTIFTPLHLSTYLSIYIPIHLSICLSTYLYNYPSFFYPSIYLNICLSFQLSIYLHIYIYLSICLSINTYWLCLLTILWAESTGAEPSGTRPAEGDPSLLTILWPESTGAEPSGTRPAGGDPSLLAILWAWSAVAGDEPAATRLAASPRQTNNTLKQFIILL